jgi:TetR/AcrR family transcriptional regulator, tetracycline repressor protein
MPRRGLTRDEVLGAAVKLVDEEGLESLSMRRLGQALGVEAMSLYNHVKSKEDLLDGVHGAILGGVKPPPRRGPWTARARALAHAVRDALRAHPRALVLFGTRPAVAPTSMALFEEALEVIAGTGLPAGERLQVVQALLSYVVGSTLWHFGSVGAESSVDYAALPADRFPRVPTLLSWSPDAEFELGLDALLLGIAARARRRTRRRRHAT